MASIDVKPYTALVGSPVDVAKFSTGSAKNALNAIEHAVDEEKVPPLIRRTMTTLCPMDDDIRELFATFPPAPLPRSSVSTIAEISAERAVGDDARGRQPPAHGLLHGGASAALAETLGSLAAIAHALPDGMAVGVDLNITHHRAVREGVVTGAADAVHLRADDNDASRGNRG